MATPPQPQLDLTSLDGTVQFFCQHGIANSTQKTYKSALRRFTNFCEMFNVLSPFPVSEAILCYFASFLANQKLSPQTIKTYLAGIRHMQITLGLPEPREFSSLPRLRLVQAGIQRVHAQVATAPTRIRLPITPTVLRQIQDFWSRKSHGDPDIIMLWAAATLCFFGFFRSGEITVPSKNAYDPKKHLTWGDISIDNPVSPSTLMIHLRQSKTDQLGRGVEVYVGKTEGVLCPVTAVTAYMASRGNKMGPFFQQKKRRSTNFIHHVRAALQVVGLPYGHFAGHSFRIGAATTAAKAGVEDSTIRMMGRWNSTAFLAYIRTPREELARFSTSLASCRVYSGSEVVLGEENKFPSGPVEFPQYWRTEHCCKNRQVICKDYNMSRVTKGLIRSATPPN